MDMYTRNDVRTCTSRDDDRRPPTPCMPSAGIVMTSGAVYRIGIRLEEEPYYSTIS